jgi:alpha-tubulin suppressor-like RCC1 family protein
MKLIKLITILLIYILIILITIKIHYKQFDYFTTKYGYQCIPCEECEAGQYLDGCSGTNAGTCEPCDVSVCEAEQYLYGCSGTNAGTCISVQREVYGCGVNDKGQIGFNSGNGGVDLGRRQAPRLQWPYHIVPVSIPTISNINITETSAGTYHSLFLTNEGHVYSCGINYYGQLGFNSENKEDGREWDSEHNPYHIRPVLIPNLDNIVAISAGTYHSLFLDNNGNVYSCGYNYYGQLGLNSTDWEKNTPELIQTYYSNNGGSINYNEITITKIACAHMHSLFLTNEGRVYSCGQKNFGQLGLGITNRVPERAPKLIETYYGNNGESINYDRITIAQIACGTFYSLFVTYEEGHVYGCGYNIEGGQLGLGDYTNRNTPTLIETYYDSEEELITYTNIKINQVACSNYHSLFLTDEGRVYSCGLNNLGQLGLNSTNNHTRPQLIETYYNNNSGESINYDVITITQIACGYRCSLFLTDEGHVYSCGGNEFGNLGLNLDSPDSLKKKPTLIETYYINNALSNNYDAITVTEITCGPRHNFFKTIKFLETEEEEG